MTASILPSHLTQTHVKVNVRLCGSIPRFALSMMQQEATNRSQNAPSLPMFPSSSSNRQDSFSTSMITVSEKGENCLGKELCSQLCSVQQQPLKQQTQPQHNFFPETTKCTHRRTPPTYEAPSWAVKATGESRLEPVCDSVGRQKSVDLTSRAVFRVGRSPQSDVQLMHVTSSRRHAMLFHHTNGSCYLVDCGSAHGTYINGVRITSTPNDSNVVVPSRIRCGAIVRFGGPGAPSYMLKSFSFGLEEMRECPIPTINTYTETTPPTPILTAMLKHNTRLNSLGRTATEELMVHRHISSKRSFDSMDTVLLDCHSDDEMEHHSHHTSDRLSSPPMSPEQPRRLVSPEFICAVPSQASNFKRRRVTFSDESLPVAYPILVTPDVSSDEQDQDSEWCSE